MLSCFKTQEETMKSVVTPQKIRTTCHSKNNNIQLKMLALINEVNKMALKKNKKKRYKCVPTQHLKEVKIL